MCVWKDNPSYEEPIWIYSKEIHNVSIIHLMREMMEYYGARERNLDMVLIIWKRQTTMYQEKYIGRWMQIKVLPRNK